MAWVNGSSSTVTKEMLTFSGSAAAGPPTKSDAVAWPQLQYLPCG